MPPFWGKTKSNIFDTVRAADIQFPSDPWDHISASARDLILGMLFVDPSTRLSAADVLVHFWMEDSEQESQEQCKLDDLCWKQLEVGGSSFSTTFISKDRNYSFSDGQLEHSPAFTCKSSFSTFLTDDSTPCSGYGGFSFSNCSESSAVDFFSPVPSMPSSTFFSPSSAVEQGNASLELKVNMSKLDENYRESNLRKLFELPACGWRNGDQDRSLDRWHYWFKGFRHPQ